MPYTLSLSLSPSLSSRSFFLTRHLYMYACLGVLSVGVAIEIWGHMGGAQWLSVGLDRRGALRELDLGPTPRRTGGVSAGAQDTCVEIAHRITPHIHGLSPGPPAAPCRSAECKEHLAQTARRAARWQRVYRS